MVNGPFIWFTNLSYLNHALTFRQFVLWTKECNITLQPKMFPFVFILNNIAHFPFHFEICKNECLVCKAYFESSALMQKKKISLITSFLCCVFCKSDLGRDIDNIKMKDIYVILRWAMFRFLRNLSIKTNNKGNFL